MQLMSEPIFTQASTALLQHVQQVASCNMCMTAQAYQLYP